MLELIITVLQKWRDKRTPKKDEPLPFNVVDHAEPNVKVVDLTVEAAAIHRATEVINKKIAAGEIRTQEELKEAVLQEFSFQKIAIHEEL